MKRLFKADTWSSEMLPRQAWILWFAFLQHLTWAILLLFNNEAFGSTSLHTYLIIFGSPWVICAMLFLISAMSGYSLWKNDKSMTDLVFMIPQQILMLISGYSASQAIWSGHYADGVARSHFFIGADQATYIIAALLHTFCMISVYWGGGGGKLWIPQA